MNNFVRSLLDSTALSPAPTTSWPKPQAEIGRTPSRSKSGLERVIVPALIAFGVLVRLVQYASNRSLWLDEAQLSLDVMDLSARQLLGLLPRGQGAAPGFLLLEKLAVQTLGTSEFVLRLLPFLAGVLSIFIFYVIAKKWLSRKAALIALFFFVISSPLIYWTTQAKQYSTDVFVTLLIYLGVSAFESHFSFAAAALLGLTGAFAVWFSHPAIFTFAALCLTMFAVALLTGDRAAASKAFLMGSMVLVSFGALYWISLRHLTGERSLKVYHWGSFAPLPFSVDAISWYYHSFSAVLERSAGLGAWALAVLAFLAGVVSLFKRSPTRALFLFSPILLALFASGLHRYPFSDRFLLFAVPGLLLVVAEGLDRLSGALGPYLPAAGVVLVGLLCIEPLLHSVRILFHPEVVEEIRPVLDYVQAHQQPGDVIYVYYGAEPAFRYYIETSRFRTTAQVVIGLEGRSDWHIYENELTRLRGNKRVWMIFSHTWTGGGLTQRVWYENNDGVNEEKLLSYDLDAFGQRVDTFRAPGAAAYLYDLSDATNPNNTLLNRRSTRSLGRRPGEDTAREWAVRFHAYHEFERHLHFPGATPSISSNGVSNGIVWAIDSSQNATAGPAILHAFDASNAAKGLWNSGQAANDRDKAGPAVKFTVRPTPPECRTAFGPRLCSSRIQAS